MRESSSCENVSATIASMGTSGIREIVALAEERQNCIRLDVGQPHFPTPRHVCDDAYQAALEGFTTYAPPTGLTSLKAKIVEKLYRVNRIKTDINHVIVTNGATSGLFSAIRAFVSDGDEVLVPDPGWPTWIMMIIAAGGIPIKYQIPLDEVQPDVNALNEKISKRTKAILVNSPSNPTGKILSDETLGLIHKLAQQHGLWIVSDECYDEIYYDKVPTSPKIYDVDDRTISVFSCSKTYSMTGWRVGYCVIPDRLIDIVGKIQQPLTGSICTISQKAAESALSGSQNSVLEMRNAYRKRRDQAIETLSYHGVSHIVPDGGFFIMVKVSEGKRSTVEFAKSMIMNQGVSIIPGNTFGEESKNHIRLSFATTEPILKAGLERLMKVITDTPL